MSGVPHHSEESDHDEDSRVEVLLSSIDQTESSLPARMLNRIKQIGRAPRSAPQGTTAASMTSNVAAPRVTAMKAHVGSNRIDQGTRKMFVARTFVSISAVVVFGLATVMFQTRDSQASLGDILDDVVQAESLQLTISRDGDTAEVWLRKSGDVRWQSPGKQSYLIARGSRLWRIDEAANTARTEPNPWQDETTKQVDLLAMIGLRENAAKLRDARAVG
ncbi:MAG: hypothetical protein O3A00_27880, partial [Planctomycetota bacterium]|nr:hypothetical protein [Planctomycetota bacterium]